MKITLYEGSILTAQYTEVFDCRNYDIYNNTIGEYQNAHEAYLDTLNKVEYDIPDTYLSEYGTMNFEIGATTTGNDNLRYNYMRMQMLNENDEPILTRYAFIDSIRMASEEVITVDYSIDIWASYSKKMKLSNGILSNKLQNAKGVQFLPIGYDGNNPPNWNATLINTNNLKFELYGIIRLYDLSEDGDETKADVRCVRFGKYHDVTVNPPSDIKQPKQTTFTKAELIETVKEYALDAGEKLTTFSSEVIGPFPFDLIGSQYYELGTLYAIPAGYTAFEYADDVGVIAVQGEHGSFVQTVTGSGTIKYTDTADRDFRYKRFAFGTLDNLIQYTPNGNVDNFNVISYADGLSLKLLVEFKNTIIDFTSSFEMIYPLRGVSGEIRAQENISKRMQEIRGALSLVGGIADVGITAAGAFATGGLSLVGGSVSQFSDVTRYNYSRKTGNLTSKNRQQVGSKEYRASAGDLLGGIKDIAGGIVDLQMAQVPKYSNITGALVNADSLYTAEHGIGFMYYTADNEEQVNEARNRIGYIVHIPIDSEDEVFLVKNSPFKRDVVRMASVNVYGSFSQDIAFALKTILMNGVIIHYTKTAQDV